MRNKKENKNSKAYNVKLLSAFFIFVPVIIFAFSGCLINYQGEDFSLKLLADGSGELSITYKNFGSGETESHYRSRDLAKLQDGFKDNKFVQEALEKGVKITKRRLDFVDYILNGRIGAYAKSYEDLFKVFTNYTLTVEDRIYITPSNGTVIRAVLSEGGEIVVKGNRYTFAWPLEASDITFSASYKVKGISFRNELRNKYKDN